MARFFREGTFESFADAPLTITSTIIAESFGQFAPVLGLPALTTPAGPTGPIATVGAGSSALEAGGKILVSFTEEGVDLTDPKKVKAAFENPGLMGRVREKAILKGLPIAAFDAFSMGVAGRLFSPVRRVATPVSGNVAGRVIGGGAELGAQMVTGGVGETVGELAAGEKLNRASIAAEMIGELGSGPAEIATAVAARPTAQRSLKALSTTQSPLLRAPTDTASAAERLLPHAAPQPETPPHRKSRSATSRSEPDVLTTPVESQTPEQRATVGARIVELVRSVRAIAAREDTSPRPVTLGPVGATEAVEIGESARSQGVDLDVTGYEHTIDNFGVRHAIKAHGKAATELPRGQLPVTESDFARIPEIIARRDRVFYERTTRAGLDAVVYEKSFNDGTFRLVYVVEARTRRRTLSLVSMWKLPRREPGRANGDPQ